MWEYNPDLDTWIQINDFSGTPRRYLVSIVIDGVAYVGTGTSGANFNDFWRFDHGLGFNKDLMPFEINVYPNPAIDQVNFSISSEFEVGQYWVEIFNSVGDNVFSRQLNSAKMSWDESTNGVYIYTLSLRGEIVKSGKIVVQ